MPFDYARAGDEDRSQAGRRPVPNLDALNGEHFAFAAEQFVAAMDACDCTTLHIGGDGRDVAGDVRAVADLLASGETVASLIECTIRRATAAADVAERLPELCRAVGIL